MTLVVIMIIIQLLVPIELFSTKELPAMVPHRHPHITIVLEMIERHLRAVEDCLQRHLSKETIDYASACSEKKSKIAINNILTLCVV